MKTKLIILIALFLIIQRAVAQEDKLITIPQGIAMVLRDSRLIKIAGLDNEIAYQESLISRSALLPHLSILMSKTFNQYQPKQKFGSQTVPIADKEPFSFGIDVYQTLFDFGKSLNYFRASKESLKAVKAHTESVKRIATLEFIVAYFDFLETEKLITVAEKEVESLSSYLNDIEQLYAQGSVVENDLLPAKVKLADAKQKLIASRNDKEIVRARLNNILALPLRGNIKAQDIETSPSNLPELEEAWQSSQSQRQELLFLQDQIQASGLLERGKALESFPSIFADGSYSYAQNEFSLHQSNKAITLGAKFNLYDGGLSTADLLRERARGSQLKQEKDKLIEDIKFEVEDSFFGLKNAGEKLLVAKDALSQADENVRFYRAKYAGGSATTTEVLEAITLQTAAQTNFCRDDYELKRGYAKLMYSMGIDLSLIYERIDNEKRQPQKQ